MKLNLKRPLVFFDLETTGVQVVSDRIVEISVLKVNPDHTREGKTWRVNPGIPIPLEASNVHGITNEDVKDAPYFKDLAPEIVRWFDGADVAGYNSNKFDIPMLAEEMLRAGIDFDMDKRLSVDVQNIFHRMEQRTLEAAYRFYCSKELKDAHSAEADTLATWEVLEAQLDRYAELKNDVPFLAEFSNRQRIADLAGFIAFNDAGEEVFTFGKYRGVTLAQVYRENAGYFSWMENGDFPHYTKRILQKIRTRIQLSNGNFNVRS